MLRYLKWLAAPVAAAALLSGCATYDYPYYGYSEPYYGGYGAYSYDYGPYYYGYGYAPYYYTPGYYHGGPVFDFRYSDRDRHDYHGRSRDYRGGHDRNRGGNWDRGGGRGRPDRSSTGPRPTSRTGASSGTTTHQAVPPAPPRRSVTASRESGRPEAQGSTRLPSRTRDEQRD